MCSVSVHHSLHTEPVPVCIQMLRQRTAPARIIRCPSSSWRVTCCCASAKRRCPSFVTSVFSTQHRLTSLCVGAQSTAPAHIFHQHRRIWSGCTLPSLIFALTPPHQWSVPSVGVHSPSGTGARHIQRQRRRAFLRWRWGTAYAAPEHSAPASAFRYVIYKVPG